MAKASVGRRLNLNMINFIVASRCDSLPFAVSIARARSSSFRRYFWARDSNSTSNDGDEATLLMLFGSPFDFRSSFFVSRAQLCQRTERKCAICMICKTEYEQRGSLTVQCLVYRVYGSRQGRWKSMRASGSGMWTHTDKADMLDGYFSFLGALPARQ